MRAPDGTARSRPSPSRRIEAANPAAPLRPAAVGGRDLPQDEPAGGGQAPSVPVERLVHPSRHPGPDRRQHDLHTRIDPSPVPLRRPSRPSLILRAAPRPPAPEAEPNGSARRAPVLPGVPSGGRPSDQAGGAAVCSRAAIAGDQSFSSW